ncbi:MAG: TIGR02996 domain-containing protein [Gemmataceae bacterium]
MTDDVFLSAILIDPDDDLPRLAYADWLEEQGDPRGEFLHIQCRLARLDDIDPAASALRQRERELLDLHRPTWLGELAPLTKQSTFRRGFLDEVALVPAAFLAHAPPWPSTVRRVLVDLNGFTADRLLVEMLPESVAREHRLFPIGGRDGALWFATAEPPDDPQLLERLDFILNREIHLFPADPRQVEDAILRHYGNTVTESVECVLYEFPPEFSPGDSNPWGTS